MPERQSFCCRFALLVPLLIFMFPSSYYVEGTVMKDATSLLLHICHYCVTDLIKLTVVTVF